MNSKLKKLEENLPKNCCSFCSNLSLKGPDEEYKYDIKCVIFDKIPRSNYCCELFEPEHTNLSIEDLDNHYMNFLETCLRVPYDEYLKSAHWQVFKEKTLYENNYSCSICGSKENVNVYHIRKNLGRETQSDVIVMCSKCTL